MRTTEHFNALIALLLSIFVSEGRVTLAFTVGGAADLQLDRRAQQLLKQGKPFMANDWIVQDIESPTEHVWGRILDYNRYKEMVPHTLESEIYNEQATPDGHKNLFVRLVAGNKFVKLNFFVKAVRKPSENVMTWSLDRSKRSNIQESTGCWRVLPHPEDPLGKSRPYYRQKISLSSWVPRAMQAKINRSAATGAARWLKEHCEGMR